MNPTHVPVFLFASLAFFAVVTPSNAAPWSPASSNVITWTTNAGIPGGIPIRTSIAQTLTSTATDSTIETALANASSNQVVYLEAGTYTVGSIALGTRSGRTLRGAGMGQTVLVSSSGSQCIFSDQYGWSGSILIDSGTDKGSTAIVLPSTPNAQFSAGNLLRIQDRDHTNFVFVRTGAVPGTNMASVHRITSVSGTTIHFTPPLVWWFTNQPFAQYMNGGPPLRWFGLEDMTIVGGNGESEMLQWMGYHNWVKNVCFSNASSTAVYFFSSMGCEVRGCYIRDASGYPGQSDGFGIFFDNDTCHSLIVANAFRNMGDPILMKNRSSGNVILANIATNTAFADAGRQLPDYNAGHGAHPMMNLWEANVGSKWQHDAYHGSASHQTLFRNWFHGLSGYSSTWRITVDLLRGTYFCTIAGNILGDSSWTPGSYLVTNQPSSYTEQVIYRFGFPNSGNSSLTESVDNAWLDTYAWLGPYPDESSTNTAVIHANYDYWHNAIVNKPGEETSLPPSLFLTNAVGVRPTNEFFVYPAFDPSNPDARSATNLVAWWLLNYGTNWMAPITAIGPPTRTQTLRGLRLRRH